MRPFFFLFLACLLLTACSQQPQSSHPDVVRWLQGKTADDFDTLRFRPEPMAEYVKMTNYALRLLASTAFDSTFKGDVLMRKLTKHLHQEIVAERLNPTDNDVRPLLDTYAENGYFPDQLPPPLWAKLAVYARDENYPHIYTRFRAAWYYIPSLVFAGGTLVFYLCTFFPVLSLKHRRPVNRVLTAGFVLLLLLAVGFKTTSKQFVTKDRVYCWRY